MARDPSAYRIDGRRVPSVTEVLKMGGWIDFSGVDPAVLSRAAARGTFVHEASELIDEDDLDWSTVPREWEGYVRAYADFRQASDLEIVASEEIVRNEAYRYCGQLDRRGTLRGRPCIVDIKTSYQPSDTWGIQIAGYAATFKGVSHDRYALWLRRDGTYRLIPYTHQDDERLFLSTAVVVNGLIDRGLVTPEWKKGSEDGEA